MDGAYGGFAELDPFKIGIERRFGVAEDPVFERIAIQHVRVQDCLGVPGVPVGLFGIAAGRHIVVAGTFEGRGLVWNTVTATAIAHGALDILREQHHIPSDGAGDGQHRDCRETARELLPAAFVGSHGSSCSSRLSSISSSRGC